MSIIVLFDWGPSHEGEPTKELEEMFKKGFACKTIRMENLVGAGAGIRAPFPYIGPVGFQLG